MLDDDRIFRRRKGSGILLLLFLVAALGYPLWHWRNLGHPLMAETHVDLCRQLASVPGLAGWHRQGFAPGGAAGGCRWYGDRQGTVDAPHLQAMLITTRSSGGMDLARRFEESRDETRANYGPSVVLRETGDEPRRTLAWRTAGGDDRLIEDHGVLLFLDATGMDDAALDALAEPMRAALRTDPDKTR